MSGCVDGRLLACCVRLVNENSGMGPEAIFFFLGGPDFKQTIRYIDSFNLKPLTHQGTIFWGNSFWTPLVSQFVLLNIHLSIQLIWNGAEKSWRCSLDHSSLQLYRIWSSLGKLGCPDKELSFTQQFIVGRMYL